MKQFRFFKAYTQAPWRVQVRIASIFLLVLIVVSLIAGFYLSISAQIAEAGIDIQLMEDQKTELNQQIADSQIQLAKITSANNMAERARGLGLNYATDVEGVYVTVSALQLPAGSNQPIKKLVSPQETNLMKEAYQQSLWDWIMVNIIQADIPLGGN